MEGRAQGRPVRCDSSPGMRFIRYSSGPFCMGWKRTIASVLNPGPVPGLFAQMTASSASPPAGNGLQGGRCTARSKRSSRWKRMPTRARPQIHRLAMAEALDGQAEAAEDALHRQADHGHQLADPLLPGEGQHLAEDDAGEFADAVLQARARSASMARRVSSHTSLPRGGLRQRGRWGRCWAACNPGRS